MTANSCRALLQVGANPGTRLLGMMGLEPQAMKSSVLFFLHPSEAGGGGERFTSNRRFIRCPSGFAVRVRRPHTYQASRRWELGFKLRYAGRC